MAEMHLTFELLRARERGLVGRREVAGMALGHLLGLCDTCADEYRETLERGATPATEAAEGVSPDYPPEAYRGLVDRVLGRLADFEASARDRGEDARARAAALLELPVEEALDRIAEDRAGRDRDGADPDTLARVAEKLLEASIDAASESPRHAFDAARLAEATAWSGVAAERAGGGPAGSSGRGGDRWHELLVRATARQGDAARLLGDPGTAERLFSAARAHLRGHRVTDLRTYAEIDALEGSLYARQGRVERAKQLLERASTFYALREDRLNLARTLAAQSSVLGRNGEPHAALASAEAARSLVPPGLDDELLLEVSYDKVLAFLDLGLLDLARNALDTFDALAGEDADPRVRGDLCWLEARLELALDHRERARAGLLDARRRYLEQGDRTGAARAVLDLATLALREGRPRSVRERVREAADLLAGQELDDRATRVLEQLGEAARRERVDPDLLDGAVRVLRRLFP